MALQPTASGIVEYVADVVTAELQPLIDGAGTALADIDAAKVAAVGDVTAEGTTQITALQDEGAIQIALASDEADRAETAADGVASTLEYYSDGVLLEDVTRGSTTPDTGSASNSNVQFCPDATLRAGTLNSFSARFASTGTGEIHIGIIDAATQTVELIAKQAVTISTTGVNTFPLSIDVPAGAYVGYKRLTGVNVSFATGGRNFTVPGGSLVTVGNTGPYTAATADLAISYTVEELSETLDQQLSEFRTRTRTPLLLSSGWNHVLGYGQSLSIGSDAVTIINSVASAYHKTFNVGVKMTNPSLGGLLASQDDGAVKALVEDTNSPFTGTTGETSLSSFTRDFSRRYARTKGTPPVWFASTAGRGGQALQAIDNFTAQYANFIYHVTAAKAGAVTAGVSYAVPVVLFKHGESDQSASTTKAIYKAGLIRLIERAKLEIMEITGQVNEPQWLFTLPAWNIVTSSGATDAIRELCDERDDCWVSVPTYRIPHVNSTHPSAAGQVLMGKYEARVVAQLAAGQTPDRMRFIGASANGTAFTAIVSGPTAAAFNTTIIGAATDHGIKIVDDTGTLTLSSLAAGTAVQNINTGLWETPITCTLNRTLGTNPKFRYARDYLGSGLTITNGASGNVFDTSTETAVISGTTYTLAYAAEPVEINVFIEE